MRAVRHDPGSSGPARSPRSGPRWRGSARAIGHGSGRGICRATQSPTLDEPRQFRPTCRSRRRQPAPRPAYDVRAPSSPRPAPAGREHLDPGCKLRGRPHGPADCKMAGCGSRDRHLDQRRATRPACGVWGHTCSVHQGSRLARTGPQRHCGQRRGRHHRTQVQISTGQANASSVCGAAWCASPECLVGPARRCLGSLLDREATTGQAAARKPAASF